MDNVIPLTPRPTTVDIGGWVVDQIVPRGVLCFAHGEPGLVESFIRDLADSVAEGNPWRGDFKTVQGPVHHLAGGDEAPAIDPSTLIIAEGFTPKELVHLWEQTQATVINLTAHRVDPLPFLNPHVEFDIRGGRWPEARVHVDLPPVLVHTVRLGFRLGLAEAGKPRPVMPITLNNERDFCVYFEVLSRAVALAGAGGQPTVSQLVNWSRVRPPLMEDLYNNPPTLEEVAHAVALLVEDGLLTENRLKFLSVAA